MHLAIQVSLRYHNVLNARFLSVQHCQNTILLLVYSKVEPKFSLLSDYINYGDLGAMFTMSAEILRCYISGYKMSIPKIIVNKKILSFYEEDRINFETLFMPMSLQ